MKKNDIVSVYTFLGSNLKINLLTDHDLRVAVVGFLRALRKAVSPIFDELKVLDTPALKGEKAVENTILEEEYTGDVPKIKADYLLEAISLCGVELPMLTVLNVFDPFIED